MLIWQHGDTRIRKRCRDLFGHDAPDLAAQKKIGMEIQLQAFQSVPYWPLGLEQDSTAYRRDITGVLEGFAKFWNVRRI